MGDDPECGVPDCSGELSCVSLKYHPGVTRVESPHSEATLGRISGRGISAWVARPHWESRPQDYCRNRNRRVHPGRPGSIWCWTKHSRCGRNNRFPQPMLIQGGQGREVPFAARYTVLSGRTSISGTWLPVRLPIRGNSVLKLPDFQHYGRGKCFTCQLVT
jgi:hypothetical protein